MYSTRNRFKEVPHHDNLDRHKISLGFIADILGGIGGAYVIFVLLPFEFQFHQISPGEHAISSGDNTLLYEFEKIRSLIQITAVSTIGGYGGRALIERVQKT